MVHGMAGTDGNERDSWTFSSQRYPEIKGCIIGDKRGKEEDKNPTKYCKMLFYNTDKAGGVIARLAEVRSP